MEKEEFGCAAQNYREAVLGRVAVQKRLTKEEAEDAYQDACVRLCKHDPATGQPRYRAYTPRPGLSIYTWMYRTTTSTASVLLRKGMTYEARKVTARMVGTDPETGGSLVTIANPYRDDPSRIIESLEMDDTASDAEEVINWIFMECPLTERQREVIDAAFFKSSGNGIGLAERLGVKNANVARSLLSKTLAKIRKWVRISVSN